MIIVLIIVQIKFYSFDKVHRSIFNLKLKFSCMYVLN